jgi:hypothetical protein
VGVGGGVGIPRVLRGLLGTKRVSAWGVRLVLSGVVLGLVALTGCVGDVTRDRRGDRNATDGTGVATDGVGGEREDAGEGASQTPPDRSGVLDVELGPVAAGQVVELTLPEGALGFNVTVSSGGVAKLGIEKIVSPNGTVVHDGFSAIGSVGRYGAGHDGMGSASVPQNALPEALHPQPGAWKVTFGGRGDNGRARARIQTAEGGAFRGGTLDLHLHLPIGLTMARPSPSHVVTAVSAPTDRDVNARVDAFYSALRALFGIERGTLAFHDAPADLVAINDDPTFYRAVASLTARSSDETAVHLLLTNDLYGGEYSGMSPGIPGAPSFSGSVMSGLVVLVDETVEPAADGWTWLHELGHFVGLEHTSEDDGTTFDPLGDTPECRAPRTISCGDTKNLMIPGWWPDNLPPVVSPLQRALFQAAPIYRPSQGAPR